MMCVYLKDKFGVSDHLMGGSDPVGLHVGEGGSRWIGEETTLMQIYIYIFFFSNKGVQVAVLWDICNVI